jgi:large subunit ribosomal protein L7/L12
MFGSSKRDQLQAHIESLETRVRTLDALVVQLAERAGVGDEELARLRGIADTGITPQIEALVAQGRDIEAIKAYRQHTGAGLKQAKDAIDAYRARSA